MVIRGLRLGLVVVGVALACSSHRDFQAPADAAGGDSAAAGASGDAGTPEGTTCAEDEYDDGRACRKLTVCAEDEREESPPEPDRDRVCSKVTTCGPGFWAAPGSGTEGRTCTACEPGTFSTTDDAASCEDWTTCTADQIQTRDGSSTSDVVCLDKECSTAEDRECTAECPCASGEGVCTEDEQCVQGATCVGGSGKKVGRSEDTCLAAHCDNDKLDADETSVDCGGECRCRATFEVVTLKGIPEGAVISQVAVMSRDGQRLAGRLIRGKVSYPVSIGLDGTVTELKSYGGGGFISAASRDGGILIGGMLCSDPPSCTDFSTSVAKWTGTGEPQILGIGYPLATSSSGTSVAGYIYDESAGDNRGFILNGNGWATIPELMVASGITPDGKYVAGPLQTGNQAGLWHVQTKTLTPVGSTSWTSITVSGLNGTDPAIIGQAGLADSATFIGFRWKGGVVTELGLLPGANYIYPSGVSADGSTVVGTTGDGDFREGVIWTEQGKLRSIADELKARGLELADDFTLQYADFVSDDGKIIFGNQVTAAPSFWRAVLE